MLAAIRRRATFANVVAIIALTLAVGGGSAFALKGRNTVFSDDIAPDQVRAPDAKEESFKIPRIVVTNSSETSTGAGDTIAKAAECPQGYNVTGGGFSASHQGISIEENGPLALDASNRFDSWNVRAWASGMGQVVSVYAVCERGTTSPE